MLSQVEQFMTDLIKNTHKSRAIDNSAGKSANVLYVSQEITNTLIEETHAMHVRTRPKIICNNEVFERLTKALLRNQFQVTDEHKLCSVSLVNCIQS